MAFEVDLFGGEAYFESPRSQRDYKMATISFHSEKIRSDSMLSKKQHYKTIYWMDAG